MREFLTDLRYESPVTFKVLISAILLFFVLFSFVYIPKTELTKAMGIGQLQERFSALRHALYWQSRSVFNQELKIEHSILYGFLSSISNDGLVVTSVPSGDSYIKMRFTLADIKVRDISAIRKFIDANKAANVRLEIYGEMVVVYLGGSPVNVEFINSGFAIPDLNPDSKIVDVAFATYYWNIVRGKEKSSNFYIGKP